MSITSQLHKTMDTLFQKRNKYLDALQHKSFPHYKKNERYSTHN